MDPSLPLLDPERQRRRLRLLAALAEAKMARGVRPARYNNVNRERIRELVVLRRRAAS